MIDQEELKELMEMKKMMEAQKLAKAQALLKESQIHAKNFIDKAFESAMFFTPPKELVAPASS